ncbi:dihydrofolate reductase [Nocardia higoensis]|uniref:Dihydrofolate reductase n=1 Tax=Nocardia higoensis TaxID=228599 RepID=A0ABS0DBZ6_9NOCA|nr:dihydrofolate reductase family protein [Nocardia higoensis]MBF6355986.1 dihydrofolate reductase [Nocardia higoensis]
MTMTQYYTATTLDGFLADEDNSLSWLFAVDDGGSSEQEIGAFTANVGAMCMGATTYEWLLANEAPQTWTDNYGDLPCWIFTHRDLPTLPGANLRFVSGDVADVHKEMAEAAGERNIWVMGGGDLAGQFADAGLLDEVIVSIAPVTLGAGAPLLPRRILSDRLRLTASSTMGQFAVLTYRLSPPA